MAAKTKVRKKKKIASPEALMEKALKQEEAATFDDNPVIFKPITYITDMIISGIVGDVAKGADENNVSDDVKNHLMNVTVVLATIRYGVFKADGVTPLFGSMEDLYAYLQKEGGFERLSELHIQYTKSMDLTMAEKKS